MDLEEQSLTISRIERLKSKRVCMVVHKNYDQDSRVKRYSRALTDAGMMVDVICLRDQSLFTPNEERKDEPNLRIFKIPLRRGYAGRGGYFIEYGLAFILFTAYMIKLHLKNRYHVVHIHNMPDFLVFTAWLPKILGAKLILDIHDPMPEVYMSKYRCSTDNIFVRLARIQERLSSSYACEVITANSYFRNNLIDRGVPADKITIIQNAPDTKLFDRSNCSKNSKSKNSSFTMIYPGTIAPRYGLDVAIRAMPLLLKKIPQLHFVIIGSQTQYGIELAALADKLNVSSNVKFISAIPVEEVPRHIRQADIGIYPALPDAHMSIATPTKVLEFAIMGLPIVSSRLEVVEGLLPSSGVMFFEPGNVDQFANSVLDLYENPALREDMVRNVDEFSLFLNSWENERHSYLQILDRLLASSASR